MWRSHDKGSVSKNSKFPLPWRERDRVRGKTDRIFTPTPSTSLRTCFFLPHQGGGGYFDINRESYIIIIDFVKVNIKNVDWLSFSQPIRHT
jgi:hypothetical protein